MATPAQVVSDANLNCVKEFFHQLTASLHPKVCVFHIQDRRQTELKRVSPPNCPIEMCQVWHLESACAMQAASSFLTGTFNEYAATCWDISRERYFFVLGF